MHAVRFLKWLSPALLCMSIGCGGYDSTTVDFNPEENGSNSTDQDADPFVLGDMIEPFDPPTLEELNNRVEWQENKILDSLQLLRDRQSTEPIAGTVEQALALRNNNDADNEFILSVMGRLPEQEEDLDSNATITRHTGGDVKSTNPLFRSSTTEFEVIGLTAISLIGFDWNFKPYGEPEVVATWQTSTDGLYDKFVLRDDLEWSDGKPVTAEDFAWTFQVIMSKQVPITSRTSEDELRWVEAYDDRTLVIFHKEALATNVWNCGLQVIPKHIYEESIYEDPTMQNSPYHVHYEQDPVVAGAFEITKREQGQEIILESREKWYMFDGNQVRDRPNFHTIRFRTIIDANTSLLALKTGRIDEMIISAEHWIGQTSGDDFYESNTKVRATEWTSFHFGWNCNTDFFSDVRVRRAMSYAFDYEEMHKSVHYNLYEPCNGVFHPKSRWSPVDPPSAYTYDIDRAEELLAEAGWEDSDGDGFLDKEIDGDLVPFEFTILTSNRPDRIAICILLKEYLGDIGITCHVRPMEFTVLQQKTRDHDFQAYMGGWGTGADPYTLANIFGTDEDRNFGEYSSEEVDRLFDEGLRELDPDKREEVYQQLHLVLWDDQPYTWLYYRSAFYGFNKDLRGYVFSPRGPYNYGPGFSAIWKPARH